MKNLDAVDLNYLKSLITQGKVTLFGPTVQTVGIWMIALIRIADRHRSASTWAGLAAGIAVWAPQDIWISAHAGVWSNIWIDCVAVAALLPPLAWLFSHDHRTAC